MRQSDHKIRKVALACFAIALFVRVYWVLYVQSPYDAVYSDMGGYVERARDMLAHTPTTFPRIRALYPYGAHYAYAALFYAVSYDSRTLVSLVQAVLCALPAYYIVLCASRMLRGSAGPAIAGVLTAIWYPIVWCAGYFLSEVWYLPLLYANLWLCLRFAEERRGGLALGVTGALLFAIRPQFALTFALLSAGYAWAHRRRLFTASMVRRAALVFSPWLVVVGYSAVRHRELTGRWGLISENGNINRLFADTTIAKVDAAWSSPKGEHWTYYFEPPTKSRLGEREVVRVDGYIADPDVIEPVRRAHLQDKSVLWRVVRAVNNVRLLWDKNDPWPENVRATHGARRVVRMTSNWVTRWLMIPLAAVGSLLMKRRTVMRVFFAHFATLVVLSMFFFPESRYRAPYDPMMLVIAVAVGSLVAKSVAAEREERRDDARRSG